MFEQSKHSWSRAAIYGWISDGAGYLVDADARRARLPVKSTTLKPLSSDEIVQTRFAELSLIERLRLLELIYLPEAYTVCAWGDSAFNALPENGRLQRSALELSSN